MKFTSLTISPYCPGIHDGRTPCMPFQGGMRRKKGSGQVRVSWSIRLTLGRGCKNAHQKGEVAAFRESNSHQQPRLLAAGEREPWFWVTHHSLQSPFSRKFGSAFGTWLASQPKNKPENIKLVLFLRNKGSSMMTQNWLEIWSQTDMGFHSEYPTLDVIVRQSL